MASPIVNIKFTADLIDFSTGMQNASRKIDNIGKKLKNIGAGLTVGITAPITGLGFKALQSAADLEKLQVSLNTVFKGNEAAAKQAFNQINRFTAETPFQLREVAEGFIKLKNLGLDPSIDSLRSYGNTASALGKDLNQFIEAVADASVFEFERLKEFGIKSKQQGDKVSFTFQGVTKTINKNAKDIERYLQDIGNVQFAGGIEKQAQTFNGRLSTLRDNLDLMLADFGAVIIEGLEPFVASLQDGIKVLKDLNPETKKTITIIAGLAAALGPVIIVTGSLIRNINVMIPLVKSLSVAIASNPIGAFATVVTALAGSLLIANSRFTPLTNATEEYNELTKQATASIAKEKAELTKYLSIARNDALTKEERQKAIKKLNDLSPKYLGDLTLEKVNTKEAKKATDEYINSLLIKAKVLAAEEKLVEVQKQLLDLQLGQSDAVKPSVWQNLKNALLSAGNAGIAYSLTAQTVADNLVEENSQLKSLEAQLIQFINQNDAFIKSNKGASDSIKEINDAIDSRPKLESVVSFKVDGETFDFAGINEEFDAFEFEYLSRLAKIREEALKFKEQMRDIIAGGLSDTFSAFSQSFVKSLDLADSGFEGFLKSFIQNVSKLISVLLSQSLANAITGATQSGVGTGPAAAFTTPGFIAALSGAVISAFAAIPKFATGGVVPGGSFYGDKILARLNSGELVLNKNQQRNLDGMLQGSAISVRVTGNLIGEGRNLKAVIDTQNSFDNRVGG